MRPEQCRKLEHLEYTLRRLECFEQALNMSRQDLAEFSNRGAILAVLYEGEADPQILPLEAGHDRFNEFILFQRELRRIIHARICEIRLAASRIVKWLTRDPPQKITIQTKIQIRPGGNHNLGFDMKNFERAIVLQAEAIHFDELKKGDDIERLRRFMCGAMLITAQFNGEMMDKWLTEMPRYTLTIPRHLLYFDRPDLFAVLDS